jgi:hydrogenase expression/formation protein HypC
MNLYVLGPGWWSSPRYSRRVVITITVSRVTERLRVRDTGDIPTRRVRPADADHPPPQGESLVCLAIPGQVIEIVDPVNQIARVDVVGVRRNINVSLLAEEAGGISCGDWVLIHVGFAISRIDEEEARSTRELLEGIGLEYEQELEELKASVIE